MAAPAGVSLPTYVPRAVTATARLPRTIAVHDGCLFVACGPGMAALANFPVGSARWHASARVLIYRDQRYSIGEAIELGGDGPSSVRRASWDEELAGPRLARWLTGRICSEPRHRDLKSDFSSSIGRSPAQETVATATSTAMWQIDTAHHRQITWGAQLGASRCPDRG